MGPVEYMVDYFNLSPYISKETLGTAFYMLYFYVAMEGFTVNI